MTTGIDSLSEQVDYLLERYLQLLSQYTELRASLSTTQSAIHQDIARANFTADRGIRYGQDFYDLRMQAMRTCCVTLAVHDSTPSFTIERDAGSKVDESQASSSERRDKGSRTTGNNPDGQGVTLSSKARTEEAAADGKQEDRKKVPYAGKDEIGLNLEKLHLDEQTEEYTHIPASNDTQAEQKIKDKSKDAKITDPESKPGRKKDSDTSAYEAQAKSKTEEDASVQADGGSTRGSQSKSESTNEKKTQAQDPIKMFGLFVPPPLRTAQTEAFNMLENIIPQLLSIDAEMKSMEISIRRARKHRAKAEAEAKKTGLANGERSTVAIESGGT